MSSNTCHNLSTQPQETKHTSKKPKQLVYYPRQDSKAYILLGTYFLEAFNPTIIHSLVSPLGLAK